MFQGRHKGINFRLKVGIAGNWVWEGIRLTSSALGKYSRSLGRYCRRAAFYRGVERARLHPEMLLRITVEQSRWAAKASRATDFVWRSPGRMQTRSRSENPSATLSP